MSEIKLAQGNYHEMYEHDVSIKKDFGSSHLS